MEWLNHEMNIMDWSTAKCNKLDKEIFSFLSVSSCGIWMKPLSFSTLFLLVHLHRSLARYNKFLLKSQRYCDWFVDLLFCFVFFSSNILAVFWGGFNYSGPSNSSQSGSSDGGVDLWACRHTSLLQWPGGKCSVTQGSVCCLLGSCK